MKIRFALIGTALAWALTQPAVAEDLGKLGPDELLSSLRSEIAALKKAETALNDNTKDAAKNRAELEALNREGERLSTLAAAQNASVETHNRQVERYNAECLGKKLPETIYTKCFTLMSQLEAQKEKLDADGAALSKGHAAYNQKVAAFNDRENKRAGTAAGLLKAFRAADDKIRFIQVRLYELSTRRDESGFAEKNRQCTLRSTLDEVYSCFAGLWP